MTIPADLPIGSYGVTATSGFFGFLIRIGTLDRRNHAFLYIGNGQITEATPRRGVIVSQLSKYPNAVFNLSDDLSGGRGERIAANARSLIGRPYGFLDILWMSLTCLGFRWKWLLKQVQRQDRLICSQDVDLAYSMDGFQLFSDGRPPCVVNPGDLVERLVNN